jgi:hypothetical protein
VRAKAGVTFCILFPDRIVWALRRQREIVHADFMGSPPQMSIGNVSAVPHDVHKFNFPREMTIQDFHVFNRRWNFPPPRDLSIPTLLLALLVSPLAAKGL